MRRQKTVVVVLLAFTSVFAGCTGSDGADGLNGLDANESRIAELEAELASKNATIAILLGNISDMQGELDTFDSLMEMYSVMFIQIQNDINWQNQTIDLSGADLGHAPLTGADLGGANLSYAYLVDADLRYADLRYADLRYADLRYADLGGANLRYADLGGANLGGANLSGANLFDVHLGGHNWYDTTCPDGSNSDENEFTCVNNL